MSGLGVGCPFCAIVEGRASVEWVRVWEGVVSFVPLSPVVWGHVLVVPRRHVVDVGCDPVLAGEVMVAAAELAGELEAVNVITSRGVAATQSVWHLHVHVVPRVVGDGLRLPWV